MDQTTPHALLLVLDRCSDPDLERELDRWFAPGFGEVQGAACYRKVASACDPFDASHLAICETLGVDTDLWRVVEGTRERLQRHRQEHPAPEARLVAAYQPIGHPVHTRDGHSPVTGLVAALTDCTDPAREGEYVRWYDEELVPVTVSTGLFHTGRLYRRVAPEGPGAYLALYFTDAPDLTAVWQTLTTDYRPQWQAEGKYIDFIHILMMGMYQRIPVSPGSG